jgi:hypothetical protein
MNKLLDWRGLLPALLCLVVMSAVQAQAPAAPLARYDALVALFAEWRTFAAPPVVNGVPDYTAATMAAQHRALAGYQRRLAALDTTGWTIAQRVDYHLVQAEMNGLDFDHRIRQPWARNPTFYTMLFPAQSDVPAREGPVIHGAIELWQYPLPLSPEHARVVGAGLRAIPPLLEQARRNLVGEGRDLWVAGIGPMKQQAKDLADLLEQVKGTSLEADARRAREATETFVAWLEQQAPTKQGPSGVGVEHYNWYLKHVHLVPYTWEEQVTIMHRELARAHAALRLEEHRNRHLPPLTPLPDATTYDLRLQAAVTEYMTFLEEAEVVSIRAYMDAALRARIGRYSPPRPDGRREFFSEVNIRDGVVMRTHGYHWFDLARMAQEPHPSPIRRVPLLHNIFDSRAEGLATGMEEMLMHAGLFDHRPRARELVWIMLAQRAARALGDLMMHANRWTMAEAARFASDWTPRGWLPLDGNTVWFEQHLYLQQPAYGTSYVMGKIEIEHLLAERARQLGDAFTLKQFMDELNAAGMIPVSLLHWELTGQPALIHRLASP